MQADDRPQRMIVEEIEVSAFRLGRKLRELIAAGGVRRLRIVSASGGHAVSIPLSAGIAAGGILAMVAPWVMLAGGMAALASRFRLEIIREVDIPPPSPRARG